MCPTVPEPARTTPDRRLVLPRPTPAKARLRDNDGQDRLSGVVSEAAKQAYGKQGAAAAQLGKDEGNFARDMRAERLTMRDSSDLGAPFLAALGKELVEQYGALSDPKDHARQLCDEMQAIVNQFRQFVDAA